MTRTSILVAVLALAVLSFSAIPKSETVPLGVRVSIAPRTVCR